MDPKDSCCCGPFRTDIQTGAFLVAIAGVSLSLLSAIVSFLPSAEWHEHDPLLGVASLFSAILYSAVIFGQKKKKPVFFLPFLIFGAIDIIYYFFLALAMLVRSISPPEDLVKKFELQNPGSTNPEKDFKLHTLLEFVFLLFGNALSIFFFWIIWKSYKKTREEIGQTGQAFGSCV